MYSQASDGGFRLHAGDRDRIREHLLHQLLRAMMVAGARRRVAVHVVVVATKRQLGYRDRRRLTSRTPSAEGLTAPTES